MPPRPAATDVPPATPAEAQAVENYGARLDQIDERLNKLADVLGQFTKIQIPSPQALDELELRLAAIEERPEPVDYDDEEARPEPRAPQLAVCEECGGLPSNHFDDCVSGRGGDALPKTTDEREAAERRERRRA